MNDLATLRRFYARHTAANVNVTDQRVIDAFATVPREAFVGSGPWQVRTASGYISTETDNPAVLYQDILIGLVPGKGINNGQPSLHARSLAEASLQPGERVVHIGTGTGYYTALLAHLTGDTGRVDAFEVDEPLATAASANLATYPFVTVHARSAVDGLLPDADVIYVSAGVDDIPTPWLDALTPGGRLIVPLTPSGGLGHMWAITRQAEGAYSARAFTRAAFIPCVGAHTSDRSRSLTEAIGRCQPDRVRWLRRGTPPDATAWHAGDGWWLSTGEA